MTAPSYIHLKRQKSEIISEWEKRSRAQVCFPGDSTTEIICCDTEVFLDEMAISLKNLAPELNEKQREIVLRHGKERSKLEGFTLNDLLREYGILRQVLIEFLHAPFEMSESELKVFNHLIDSAMELAGYEFAKTETSEMQQALTQAEASNKALAQFASVLAHDFRSPLATLFGFTDLLEEEISTRDINSEEVDDTLKRMKKSIHRAMELVDGLLKHAQLSSQMPALAPVNMNDVVSAAWENIKADAKQKHAHLITDSLPTVPGSFPFLTQLFQNLFSNSLKFCKDKEPMIQVKVIDKQSFWQFDVQDNGIGFSENDKDSIFQLHRRLNSDVPGSGIGLSTCKKVLDIHHGKIWAESIPGNGAHFYFTLPKLELRPT
jgi:signal transduction histidine kinase